MNQLSKYKKQQAFGGWTRIDLLLSIYKEAIAALTQTKEAFEAQDFAAYPRHLLAAQKAILAIHAGLKPDEYEVAFNVARLLHFVLRQIESKQFDEAIKVLSELYSGFDAIYDEAVELERSGKIEGLLQQDELAMQL